MLLPAGLQLFVAWTQSQLEFQHFLCLLLISSSVITFIYLKECKLFKNVSDVNHMMFSQHRPFGGSEVTWPQLWSAGLEKDPSCLVLTSLSCSSCRCPRRYKYSMYITSVFLMWAFALNSSRIRGMKPGLSWPARKNCRYRARTCFCSLLCRTITCAKRLQNLQLWLWSDSRFTHKMMWNRTHHDAQSTQRTLNAPRHCNFLQPPTDWGDAGDTSDWPKGLLVLQHGDLRWQADKKKTSDG